jgi:hypothetical protein
VSPKLVNITQLRSNCRSGYAPSAISVKAFPPQADGNWGECHQRRVQKNAMPECIAIAKQLPWWLCPARNFRESVPAARRAEIAASPSSTFSTWRLEFFSYVNRFQNETIF